MLKAYYSAWRTASTINTSILIDRPTPEFGMQCHTWYLFQGITHIPFDIHRSAKMSQIDFPCHGTVTSFLNRLLIYAEVGEMGALGSKLLRLDQRKRLRGVNLSVWMIWISYFCAGGGAPMKGKRGESKSSYLDDGGKGNQITLWAGRLSLRMIVGSQRRTGAGHGQR